MGLRSLLNCLGKILSVVGFSVMLIPFILTVAFGVLKANLLLKTILVNKDSFFYNNFGDVSWIFNLMVILFFISILIFTLNSFLRVMRDLRIKKYCL